MLLFIMPKSILRKNKIILFIIINLYFVKTKNIKFELMKNLTLKYKIKIKNDKLFYKKKKLMQCNNFIYYQKWQKKYNLKFIKYWI